ncbi:conserved hypothetical protein [Ignisphaera aggregans DSM 17230]|uniref:Uncharacterized protein n=1 Tax=Ignisphaera aggregans (strain DSM 17230 / JCM 13409 / AQ1.S1) TaxID=583356 RepID=E0SRJ1_IGNAA|nr:conserved hypothetical protein [Ignisphaera aggregans DSM 17230]
MNRVIITMIIVLLISSIVFLGISTWLLYIEKPLQALLSLVIGIILLSASLSLAREYSMESSR